MPGPDPAAGRTASSGGGSSIEESALEAVAHLYHAFLTGLILLVVARKSPRHAAELVFRLFRRKHLEQFLPGLAKLGLSALPDAVACAQYHYLSNHLGGVGVEYIYESDRKAWIRYPPPRWIWAGTAIAGVPSEVSAAMLRGWHGHNGVSLENPRLGFVCTGQTVDGEPGLEGYYLVGDRDLEPDERLRFVRGERAPRFDPAAAPAVDSASWPAERLAKAHRNYAMDYASTALLVLLDCFGSEEGRFLGGLAARLIALQHTREIATQLGIEGSGGDAFAELFARLARAQGDFVEIDRHGDTIEIRQSGWHLMRRVGQTPVAAFEAWNELWSGGLASIDRFLEWQVVERHLEEPRFVWRIQPAS